MLNKIFVSILLATLALLSAHAQAHRTWLLPSATVFSGEEPWLSVDAAVSNSLFYFEHYPLNIENLKIIAPDEKILKPENTKKLRYRTVFDLPLKQKGTYTLEITRKGNYGSYTLKGEKIRVRNEKDIPEAAKNIVLNEGEGLMQTFVTKGAPSLNSIQVKQSGLSLKPITHPNDLFVGETARFQFLLDGKPAKNLKVTLIKGDSRYRNQEQAKTFTSNNKGIVEINVKQAGMYWLNAELELKHKNPKYQKRHLSYTATLEFLPL